MQWEAKQVSLLDVSWLHHLYGDAAISWTGDQLSMLNLPGQPKVFNKLLNRRIGLVVAVDQKQGVAVEGDREKFSRHIAPCGFLKFAIGRMAPGG